MAMEKGSKVYVIADGAPVEAEVTGMLDEYLVVAWRDDSGNLQRGFFVKEYVEACVFQSREQAQNYLDWLARLRENIAKDLG